MNPTKTSPKCGPAAGEEQLLALELLKYAAADLSSGSGQSLTVNWRGKTLARQFRHVIAAGLAPLLYRATQCDHLNIPQPWRDELKSADLTARVRHGNLIDTANEIIDICNELRVPVTLLKGISISDQRYPAAHLRPMGDIDVLVPEASYQTVEAALVRLGYSPRPGHEAHDGAHHGAPLFQSQRRVWVELHSALFPKDSALRRNTLFSPAQVAAQTINSTFHGRPVYRLTVELQLAYIASTWVSDISSYKLHPSFIPPLVDATVLLNTPGETVDWQGLLGWIDNEMARASLYVMLSYLSHLGLAHSAAPVLSRVARSQDIVGAAELGVIHALLDFRLAGGKQFPRYFSDWQAMIALNTLVKPGSGLAKLLLLPWNYLFPPLLADRYRIRLQLGRIRRLLGLGS